MATAPSPLRFAYSTINCGTTLDLANVATEIRECGWGAVELFWHDLGWLDVFHIALVQQDAIVRGSSA